jgi:predicted molibdopterin-dependent oxidoreductase YjgC
MTRGSVVDREKIKKHLRLWATRRAVPAGPASIVIRVDGRPVRAVPGESVLAALHAAGILALRRSDLGREPRGALCGMGVCFECRVTVNGRPGIQACMTTVEDGMDIRTDGY